MAEVVRDFLVKADKATSEMSYETSQELAEAVAKRKSIREKKLYKVYMLVSAHGPTLPPFDWLKISEHIDMGDMDEDEAPPNPPSWVKSKPPSMPGDEDETQPSPRPLVKSKPPFKPMSADKTDNTITGLEASGIMHTKLSDPNDEMGQEAPEPFPQD